jgi:phosphoribosylformimino-5-aminoimidazole carboxamide ribotide isomerase
VVAGFLALHDFPILYIADLDTIEGRGSHQDTILALEEAFPQVSFWVDTGVGDAEAAQNFLSTYRASPVLGSESLKDIDTLTSLAQNPRVLLSLDFRGEDFQGAPKLLTDTALWPSLVIVMTLARVGSHEGPDLTRLSEIVGKAGDAHRVYAAGGLRGAEDLAPLDSIGVEGVLVASALHDGRLDSKTLAQWMK